MNQPEATQPEATAAPQPEPGLNEPAPGPNQGELGPSPQPVEPEQWLRSPAGTEGGATAPPVQASPPPVNQGAGPWIRIGTPLSTAAEVPAVEIQKIIAGTDRIQKSSPITVTVRNQTAILRGSVATEHDRRLAEAVVRLEPGIAQVRNELTVQTQQAATSSSRAIAASR